MEIIEAVNKPTNSLADRVFALGYSLFAYAVGAGALFWLIFAAGGYAPLGFIDIAGGNVIAALVINTLLVTLFGVQHSVMARSKFKKNWYQDDTVHLERSTFVLVSGIVSLVVIALWQVLDATIWKVENATAGLVLQVLYGLGILYLLASSFVTNHFELFGLRQAWLFFTNRPYTPLQFKQRLMYRYSRHPMMLGFLFIFWATPEMTVTRLVFALLFTLYIFEGIRHEEDGLIEEFGDKYREYRKQIGMFFTVNK